MNKEKELREIEKIIIDSDLYQTFIGQNVDYSSVEKKLASAIQSHIDEEIKVARAHQEMETYCAMKKKYKSRRLSEGEIYNIIKPSDPTDTFWVDYWKKKAHAIFKAQEKKDET